jgi:hypothetical protein
VVREAGKGVSALSEPARHVAVFAIAALCLLGLESCSVASAPGVYVYFCAWGDLSALNQLAGGRPYPQQVDCAGEDGDRRWDGDRGRHPSPRVAGTVPNSPSAASVAPHPRSPVATSWFPLNAARADPTGWWASCV